MTQVCCCIQKTHSLTSPCHLLAANREKPVEGICGVVQDGVIPGFWGYEAGQSGVGDWFAWYVQNGISAELGQAAKKAKQDETKEEKKDEPEADVGEKKDEEKWGRCF